VSRLGNIALRAAPWVALAAALVAATRFAGDLIWPCPVSCQGGGHYQHLYGVPVHVPATVLMLAVAVLGWLRRREAAWLAWSAAGGSLYFLWVAWQLGLYCPYCFTVHGLVVSTALLVLPAQVRRLDLPVLALLAFLGLHLAFHPGIVADGPEVVPPVPDTGAFFTQPTHPGQTAVGTPAMAAIDALRRQGSANAAYVLEVAIDLHCPHCAATFGPLNDALRRSVEAGRVEVVYRFLTRRSDPSGRDLAAHVLASRDATQARLMTSLLLGTPEGRGWAEVRSRVAEVADTAAIASMRSASAAAIDAVLAQDGEHLRTLGAQTTPFAAMSHRGSKPYLRWEGDAFDPQAIAREIPWD
jgi:protein-disulfide isomerase